MAKKKRTPAERKDGYPVGGWIPVAVASDGNITQVLSLMLPPTDADGLCNAQVKCESEDIHLSLSLAMLFDDREQAHLKAEGLEEQLKQEKRTLSVILGHLGEAEIAAASMALDAGEREAHDKLAERLKELRDERTRKEQQGGADSG